jgi:hypothetical protein
MKGCPTFLAVLVLVAAVIGAGCATVAPPPGTTAFTGEVWTWDEQENTVTLRQGTRDIRVNVTPDTFRVIRLHEVRTIHGTLAPPKALPTVLVEGPSRVVPRGAADEMEVAGTVASVDVGKMVVNSPQGPLHIWRATNGLPFTPGRNVRVRVRVQPLDVVLVQPGQAVATAPAPGTMDPAAAPRTDPGDYAVVMGRIIAIDPSGALTMESARGPVMIRVPNASRYKVGDTVEVRTSVHPA